MLNFFPLNLLNELSLGYYVSKSIGTIAPQQNRDVVKLPLLNV